MAEYFIGMHCEFDEDKYLRDFTKDITGIEFCNFGEQEEIEKLVRKAREDNYKIGVHFPLNKASYKYRDPLVVALDEGERIEAFKGIERELEFGRDIGIEYLLMHFPKPMPLDESLNWAICSFASPAEREWQRDYPYDIFKDNCYKAFEKLSELSNKYGIQIVLELDFVNKYLYEGGLLKALLEKYSNIKLCLDSARIHVQSKIDKSFEFKIFIKDMAKYTYSLHLSNVKVTDKLDYRHYPPLKTLKVEDGWGDTAEFLRIISEEKKDLKILFEHDSKKISYEELMECYQWIKSYFER